MIPATESDTMAAVKFEWRDLPDRVSVEDLIETVLRSELSGEMRRRVVLTIKSVTQSDIAREAGVTRQMVGTAFGTDRSRTVEEAAERVLGIPKERLWSEHYGSEAEVEAGTEKAG